MPDASKSSFFAHAWHKYYFDIVIGMIIAQPIHCQSTYFSFLLHSQSSFNSQLSLVLLKTHGKSLKNHQVRHLAPVFQESLLSRYSFQAIFYSNIIYIILTSLLRAGLILPLKSYSLHILFTRTIQAISITNFDLSWSKGRNTSLRSGKIR